MEFNFLNTKQMKEIRASIKEQFDADVLKGEVLLQNNSDDVFLINRDVDVIPLENLRINNLGLYIGEFKNKKFRPSIEGAQLIGPHAKKGIVDVSIEERDRWMKGEDLKSDAKGYVLLRSNDQFIGCGAAKEGSIKNFVPKARRISD